MTANNAKPTPGPWEYEYDNADNSGGGQWYEVRTASGNPLLWRRYGCTDAELAEAEENAALMAEAGNVYHETGLTPRQLAEQRAELLAALSAFDEWYDRSLSMPVHPDDYAALKAAVRIARALIARCKETT